MDMKLKRALSLVGVSDGRPEDDFYPTPSEVTRALLSVEDFHDGIIWECAAGDGAMSSVLQKYTDCKVLSTDINPRFDYCHQMDFLQENLPKNFPVHKIRYIVTNPPFKLAEQFVHKALEYDVVKLSLLCKLQFLEGQTRRTMFESTPFARVHIFSDRISLYRNGNKMKNSGMIAFAWFVWDKYHLGKPTIDWICSRDFIEDKQ